MESIVPALRERGFRKWYERELLRGHLQLVLVVLGAIGALAAAEAFRDASGTQRTLMLGCLLAAAAVGAFAIRRYAFHLARAEHLAQQSDCPGCRDWGGWRLDPAAQEGSPALRVRCRRCSERWTIRC